MKPHQMNGAKALVTLLAGALFGFGLSLATMAQPEVVIGFLRLQDWGLMFVMGGAAGVTVVLITHRCLEAAVMRATEQLEALDAVLMPPVRLRVESFS